MLDELLPFERAAIISWHVIRAGHISRGDVINLTGLSKSGATNMLCRLSRVLPIYYDCHTKRWHVVA